MSPSSSTQGCKKTSQNFLKDKTFEKSELTTDIISINIEILPGLYSWFSLWSWWWRRTIHHRLQPAQWRQLKLLALVFPFILFTLWTEVNTKGVKWFWYGAKKAFEYLKIWTHSVVALLCFVSWRRENNSLTSPLKNLSFFSVFTNHKLQKCKTKLHLTI